MTYGDFAWKDVMDRASGEGRRRRQRAPKMRVSGEPALFLDADAADWSWRVSRVVKTQLARPKLDFVVSRFDRYGRPFSLDDLAKPVIDVVSNRPRSIWVRAEKGDDPGLRIGESTPPFPLQIDRSLEIPVLATRNETAAIKKALGEMPGILGSGPIGAYLSLGPVNIREFGFGGPVRVILDGLAVPLGSDSRIRDLRVVCGRTTQTTTEVMLWASD